MSRYEYSDDTGDHLRRSAIFSCTPGKNENPSQKINEIELDRKVGEEIDKKIDAWFNELADSLARSKKTLEDHYHRRVEDGQLPLILGA